MNEKLNLIRETCIAAIPSRYEMDGCSCGREWPRPLRLADVLLAIGKEYVDLGVNCEGQWENAMGVGITGADNAAWNLRADDLEKQSEETIRLLHELLK
jgi:hypothetical protein